MTRAHTLEGMLAVLDVELVEGQATPKERWLARWVFFRACSLLMCELKATADEHNGMSDPLMFSMLLRWNQEMEAFVADVAQRRERGLAQRGAKLSS